MPTIELLKELQAAPFHRKVAITQTRIMEWYFKFKGQVYVSFSGGKDSTVQDYYRNRESRGKINALATSKEKDNFYR